MRQEENARRDGIASGRHSSFKFTERPEKKRRNKGGKERKELYGGKNVSGFASLFIRQKAKRAHEIQLITAVTTR